MDVKSQPHPDPARVCPRRTRIGILQGGLSPAGDGNTRAWGAGSWRQEFEQARDLGLGSIEWLPQAPVEGNPLWTEEGLQEIRRAISETGVGVEFICADFFLKSPLVRMTPADVTRNWSALRKLIEQGAKLDARGIEIPFVDASAIHSYGEEDEVVSMLGPCLDFAAERRLEIGFKTSLPPRRLRGLFKRLGRAAAKAAYDVGGRAALGFKPRDEIDCYGPLINNVHLRRQSLDGAADTPRILQMLKSSGYAGGFVLETGGGAEDAAEARRWTAQLLAWLAEAGFE